MKKTIMMLMIFAGTIANAADTQKGIASWYGKENRKSSTGKILNHNTPALAHKTLPIGTYVKVVNTKNKKSVVAVVEDRGPYIAGRIVDLNIPAAKELGIIESGLAKVTVEKIK